MPKEKPPEGGKLSNSCVLDLRLERIELAGIEAESIGWLPLGEGAYLHVGDPEALVINVVGVPEVGMVGMNVLLIS